MSDHTTDATTDAPRATSLGQTGGLPGANATPAASELTDDEVAITLPPAGAGATTDVDSHDDGRGAEGEAYDEPDTGGYGDELRTPSEDEIEG